MEKVAFLIVVLVRSASAFHERESPGTNSPLAGRTVRWHAIGQGAGPAFSHTGTKPVKSKGVCIDQVNDYAPT